MQFLHHMKNISYHMAVRNIGEVLSREIIEAFLNGKMEDDSLKMKILDAMSNETK